MKKYIVALLCGCASLAVAAVPASNNRSSFTQTNDTTQRITAAYLDKIIISAASTGGVLTVYNSTWTTTPVISSITLGTVGTYHYNDLGVAGLVYTTISNTAGVTIIYKR